MSPKDLLVPAESVAAFRRLCSQVEPEWTTEERVLAIARPLLLAELRRLCPGALVTRAQIDARIEELSAS